MERLVLPPKIVGIMSIHKLTRRHEDAPKIASNTGSLCTKVRGHYTRGRTLTMWSKDQDREDYKAEIRAIEAEPRLRQLLQCIETFTVQTTSKILNDTSSPPNKIITVATPTKAGMYPVLLLLPGFWIKIDLYKQLMEQVSSYGYIVVAAQLYTNYPRSTTEDVDSAAAVANWLTTELQNILPSAVEPDFEKVALAGHSRGAHTAFALALGHATTNLKLAALIGLDPVAGTGESSQIKPEILTYEPESFELNGLPELIIGSDLGEKGALPFLPPCAPAQVNYREFFNECRLPRYLVVLKDLGHMDVLNDDAGFITKCPCKNGKCRARARSSAASVIIIFLKAKLEGRPEILNALFPR